MWTVPTEIINERVVGFKFELLNITLSCHPTEYKNDLTVQSQSGVGGILLELDNVYITRENIQFSPLSPSSLTPPSPECPLSRISVYPILRV